MSLRRLRGMLLSATALLAGLVLLAWSQPWFMMQLTAASGAPGTLEVRGDVAAAALVPLALTVLAMVAALALAGAVFRVIFGVLEMLLGASIIGIALVTLGDPVAASAKAVTDATGISGADSVAALVASLTVSAWPAIAIVAGGLIIAVGALVTITARRWPVSGRRYSRTRVEPAGSDTADPITEWDALSEGDDPTTPAR